LVDFFWKGVVDRIVRRILLAMGEIASKKANVQHLAGIERRDSNEEVKNYIVSGGFCVFGFCPYFIGCICGG
jgi:hypothetical protein